MLMRFDPFRELDRVTEQLWQQTGAGRGAVPMDAFRRGEQVVARFDLPGVDPESIDLTVERNVLTLRAERTASIEEGDELIVSERPRGTFTRQLFLGETLRRPDRRRLPARRADGHDPGRRAGQAPQGVGVVQRQPRRPGDPDDEHRGQGHRRLTRLANPGTTRAVA
jgi:HSP20 family protein